MTEGVEERASGVELGPVSAELVQATPPGIIGPGVGPIVGDVVGEGHGRNPELMELPEEVHAALPDSELHLYDDAGHAFHWECMDDFNPRVRDWLLEDRMFDKLRTDQRFKQLVDAVHPQDVG